ncbi:MAG TPA: endonuclease/exonuclease/phosphatase family protein [Longimicrobiales bacterium]|nr:endonuclease/exonuclease/phosphatase family protein [Longimicrobiales bacterium]
MRSDRPLATTALAFLFLAEGQRAYFGSLFALAYDAVFPALRPAAALLALLPLSALLVPLLPLARRLDRAGAVAVAAAGLAIFRVPLSLPDFAVRTIAATLVVACGALFLTWAVGYLDGRAVAAGAIAGLVADQLLRLAGTSWDLSLRPGWLPIQAVLSLALLFLVLAPLRGSEATGPGPEPGAGNDLERRTGGLRLRGALALGALLFLDLHLLGLPPVVGRWTGATYTLAALAVSAAGAVALVVTLLGHGPVRNRTLALGLVLLLALGLAAGPWLGGPAGAILLAAGHAAALLLLARALNPASGRRGRGVVTAGMLTFAALTALYAATFFYAFLVPILRGAAPWILGAAVLLVAAAFLLLPQPPATARRVGIAAGVGAGIAVVAASGLILFLVQPEAPAPVGTGAAATASGPGAPGAPVRVATYNIHYGYDEGWRFDPGAIAEAIRAAAPDLVALQEVPVGMPTAYGVDFPLWLERRLGIPAFFSANINRLQGEAILSRVPTRSVHAMPLPPAASDRKQLLQLQGVAGGRTVHFHALHLGVHPAERAVQLAAALDHVPAGRAVLLGDLNAEPGSPETATLRAAGFVDAFELAGAEAGGTWPAREPQMRIDWVWLRGIHAVAAEVLEAPPSDHRLVVATLQIEPPRPTP